MNFFWNISVIIFSVLFIAGRVAAEWEVLNADLEDKDDDVLFMPAHEETSSLSSSSSSSSSTSSSSVPSSSVSSHSSSSSVVSSRPSLLPSKSHLKRGGKQNAKKTAQQSTPVFNPVAQLQNFAVSANQQVMKMTSSTSNQKEHKNKSTNNNGKSKDKNKSNTVSSRTNNEDSLTEQKLTVYGPTDDSAKQSDQQKVRNFHELNDNGDKSELNEFMALRFRDIKDAVEKVEGEEEDVDCDDEINMNEYECLELQTGSNGPVDEGNNMSQAGDRAKQELLQFMDLKHRVRRQAVQEDISGVGPTTAPDEEIVPSGTLSITQPMVFDVVVPGDSKKNITDHLLEKLKDAFKGLNGFQGVKINSVDIVDNKVKVNWTLSMVGSAIGAFGENELDVANRLQFQMLNISKPLYDSIAIGGVNPMDPLEYEDIGNNLAKEMEDPCATNPCSDEYDSCIVINYNEAKCKHKCVTFQERKSCEHSGFCELELDESGDKMAVCQCSSNWEGIYCQNRRNLNKGEITGVTIGAACAFIGLIGTVAWFTLFRRRKGPVKMTHYSDADSDSSERFSSPSSRISTFVIDRPRIRTDPFKSFNPQDHDDFSRPSTLSTLPPLMGPRNPPNLFSDA